MSTQQEIYNLLQQQAALHQQILNAVAAQFPGNTTAVQAANDATANMRTLLFTNQSALSGPPPADDGDGARLGIGPSASPTIGGVFMPPDVMPYDDQVVSGRLYATGDLYYCYQHERLGIFRAVHKLQELFRAGALRLTDGQGALALYRFDVKSVLRYTREQRMQAYRRVFGYTNAAPPTGAQPNMPFHGLLEGFATRVAQLFRDRRIAEVVRGPAATVDATFGSVAATRRAGLDLRSNLKHAAYGDVNVLTVELMQLLRQAFEILGAQDVREQFGAENAWDTLEEVLKRYLNEKSVASQRSRMGTSGRDIIRWLAEPYVLVTSRTQFEALALNISEAAEEWLTSAESVGLNKRQPAAPPNVVQFRRPA